MITKFRLHKIRQVLLIFKFAQIPISFHDGIDTPTLCIKLMSTTKLDDATVSL